MAWLNTTSSFGDNAGPRRCSFCGRRADAVGTLVRTRGAYICDRCVGQAQEAISSAPPGQRLVRMRPAPGRIADRDAAELAVERAYEAALTADVPIADRCAAIEQGATLGPVFEELGARYGPSRDMDVAVDSVRFLSDDEAEVHFVLLLPQFGPSGLAQSGHAVRVDGEWKVARDTWCRLVGMVGIQCPPPEG